MLALLGIVLSIGLADSINPSIVGPALYLASGHDTARSLLGYITGVFAVSATAGVALDLGPGRALLADRPSRHAQHLIEVCAGVALLVVAAGLWRVRTRVARRVLRHERTLQRTSLFVGAGIMAIELPTALPYFAVIAAVTGSGRTPTTQVALILLFNLVLVTPLLTVFAIRQLAGSDGRDWLTRIRKRLDRHASQLIPTLVLLVAIILLLTGTIGLSRG